MWVINAQVANSTRTGWSPFWEEAVMDVEWVPGLEMMMVLLG